MHPLVKLAIQSEEVIRNAIRAAKEDPRFDTIKKREIPF